MKRLTTIALSALAPLLATALLTNPAPAAPAAAPITHTAIAEPAPHVRIPLVAELSRSFVRPPILLDTAPRGDGLRIANRVTHIASRPTPPPAPSTPPKTGTVPHSVTPKVGKIPLGAIQQHAAVGLSTLQWGCLDRLWTRESHWVRLAKNRRSTAFGIAQLLTEVSTDPIVQVDDGRAYIRSRYGTPCAALAHSDRLGWY